LGRSNPDNSISRAHFTEEWTIAKQDIDYIDVNHLWRSVYHSEIDGANLDEARNSKNNKEFSGDVDRSYLHTGVLYGALAQKMVH